MNLKVFALLTAVALLAGAITVPNLAQPVMARNNDKCVTFDSKSKDFTSTGTACVTGDHEFEDQVKDLKKQCKDNTDNKEVRCSASQTGNGEFGNFEKNKD